MENYQLIKQIGHGRYSEIWLVKCSKTRKKHVLKRIDFHQASKREQLTAHSEAKLLSTLKHPNIVTYLDSFLNSSGSLFIITNYWECGDLFTFIRNQNGVYFEEKQIVHWFAQICLALKYLHDKNILHRNLKTRNIFLTQNKIIKVGDLGLSKVLSVVHEMTATVIETPYYISPEIFSGSPFTEKSDIWALGCCTYEMATLKHPFAAPDVHSLLQKVAKRQLPPFPEVYSSELYDIIALMLENEFEERPCVTELLLSDYVRRYILLILQGHSKSPDSQVSGKFDELPIERSKSISDLLLVSAPKVEPYNVQRSLSTCFLPKHRSSKNSKMSDTAAAAKNRKTKSKIISVPDVNGNGDGNDNSQHRRPTVVDSCVKTDHRDDETGSGNSDNILLKIDSYTRNGGVTPGSSTWSSSSAASSLCSLRQSGILSASRRRMKGEISLQILNSLSHTLHNARLVDTFNDKNDYGTDGYSSYELSHSFKVSEDSSTSQLCAELPVKRTGKNVHRIELTSSKEKSQSKVCSLPKIKRETVNKKMSKPTENFLQVRSQHCKSDRPVGRKTVGDKDKLPLRKTYENELANMC